MDRYYDPPEFYEPEERDDPLDDGDYAYDKWRDEQDEREDGDSDEGFDPALDY